MLENKEKLKSIDVAEVFRHMVRDLNWDRLEAFIQVNNQVLKRCTAGGHRLEKKRRARCEKIIEKEAAKKNFEGPVTAGLFAQWYPIHEQLHKTLEDYFHSDEYKAYREEQELSEESYVLPDEKFEEFFASADLPKWKVLLCFSPLAFSDEQADRIINGTTTADDSESLQNTQEELDTLKKENNRLQVENNDLRKRLESLKAEAGELREERKTLEAEVKELNSRFEGLKTTNKRLQQEVDQYHQKASDTQDSVEATLKRERNTFEKQLEQAKKAEDTWRVKYEKQREEYRELEEKRRAAEQALAQERTAHKNTQKQVEESRIFPNALLQSIDWPKVGSNMKLSPTMKRKLNSLVKKLNYEDHKSMSVNDTIQNFWTRLLEQEKSVIAAIAESDTREVESGNIRGYWKSLESAIQDTCVGLEAREVLLKLLQEIFYQTLEVQELEDDTVLNGIMERRDKN